VEYEGMLVSAAAAQRRQFFSSLIQRAAKMHRRLRGGSMTLMLVVPGSPATGELWVGRWVGVGVWVWVCVGGLRPLGSLSSEWVLLAAKRAEQSSPPSHKAPRMLLLLTKLTRAIA
jgi:hypothetical protein